MLNFDFNPFPILETTRFSLRPISEIDIDEIFELRSDPGVNKYLSRKSARDKKEALEFIKSIIAGIFAGEWIYWGISFKDEQSLIGTICLWNISKEKKEAEIGFELLQSFQGNGFMKEIAPAVTRFGFEKIRLLTINAITHPKNKRSIRILESLGFTYLKQESAKESLFIKKAFN
jgi:ribosomal-protein-alanine N-acetyltransferase